jgi:hypothetical protein
MSTMLFVSKASYAIIPAEIIFSENVMTSIYGNKHLEMYLMLSPECNKYPALPLGSPEYYCWGEMNVRADPGCRDDRGMVVYPYDSIPERDRHLATSVALDKLMADMCLVQDFLKEKEEERKSRLEQWGLSVETKLKKESKKRKHLENPSGETKSSEEKKEEVEETPTSEDEDEDSEEDDPVP